MSEVSLYRVPENLATRIGSLALTVDLMARALGGDADDAFRVVVRDLEAIQNELEEAEHPVTGEAPARKKGGGR